MGKLPTTHGFSSVEVIDAGSAQGETSSDMMRPRQRSIDPGRLGVNVDIAGDVKAAGRVRADGAVTERIGGASAAAGMNGAASAAAGRVGATDAAAGMNGAASTAVGGIGAAGAGAGSWVRKIGASGLKEGMVIS